MNQNNINLSLEELKSLKVIGQGTEGIVYQYSNDILIKVYRKSLMRINDFDALMIAPDKIYDKDKLKEKKYNEHITFRKKENVGHIKIYSKDAISEIAKRQQNVKRTKLPKGSVFIDGKFAGCFLEKLNGIPIHKLRYMPQKFKLELIRSILLDIEELLEKNIYHLDLDNSPCAETKYMDEKGNIKILRGHSHILINPVKKSTNLLDLDGKSIVYTDYSDDKLKKYSLHSLCLLLLDFLYGVLLNDDDFEDSEILEFYLIRQGINKEFANIIANDNINSIEEIKKCLKI